MMRAFRALSTGTVRSTSDTPTFARYIVHLSVH